MFQGLSPESQDQILVLAVVYLPNFIEKEFQLKTLMQ